MFKPESEEESESAYSVVVIAGEEEEAAASETAQRSGLSHEAAMRLAEELADQGKTVRVMHVTPRGRYEVDRYPLR